ncbi:MAG: heme exporter protein CcmD [Pseudomonadota bacterium]
MSDFLAMEGYAFYVWWSYAAMAIVLIGLTVATLWRNAKVRAELAELEARLREEKAGGR